MRRTIFHERALRLALVLASLLAWTAARADSLPSALLSSDRFPLRNENMVGRGTRLAPKVVKDFEETLFLAARLLEEEHVKKVSRSQMVEWAIRGLYAELDEKIPVRLALRLEKLKGQKDAELKALLAEARTHLGKRVFLENRVDIERALAALFIKLEGTEPPYLETRPFGRGCGVGPSAHIGVETRVDARTGLLQVVTPLRDGPAHKAGIRAGDRIVRMSQEETRAEGTQKRTYQETFSGRQLAEQPFRLRGNHGTTVKLTIRRPGAGRPLLIKVIRTSDVLTETIFGVARKPDASWEFMLDRKQKIGYIRIASLSRYTPANVALALAGLKKQGLRGLILDLRFSPGGMLNSAEAIADLFVADGLLFSVRSRDEVYPSLGTKAGSHLDFPMVCLVNSETRSSSELVAACLQDHRRAVLVGERTPGDTTVKNIIAIRDLEMPVVVAVLCRASGKNLSRMMTDGKESEDWGVRPDKGFELRLTPAERYELGEQLHRLRIIPRPGPGADRVIPDLQLAMAQKHLTGGKTK